jgi:hypothetical protein
MGMRTNITRFDEELLASAQRFLNAAERHPESRAVLEKYGFSKEEQERGHLLISNSERAFECERTGTAWNFLAKTPMTRRREAFDWFVDTRWRRFRMGFVDAEKAFQSAPSVLAKVGGAVQALLPAFSPVGLVKDQITLLYDLVRAGEERPSDAPPPKDTTLVELQGWYEKWRLLAQRVFRGRSDLLAPFGLTTGKAPPRLRGKQARLKYGEGAAS